MTASERQLTNKRFVSVAGLDGQPAMQAKLSPGWITVTPEPARAYRPQPRNFVTGISHLPQLARRDLAKPARRPALQNSPKPTRTNPKIQQPKSHRELPPGKR